METTNRYAHPCKGELTIRTYDINDRLLYEYKTPNTIVNNARGILANLLRGEDVTNKKITTMKVGTGTTAPTRDDVALKDGAALSISTTSALVTGKPGEVKFSAELPIGASGDGKTFTEVGLFSEDGTMFARQVHTAQTKSSSVKLEYTWIIVFT